MAEILFFGMVVFLLSVGPCMTVLSVGYYVCKWFRIRFRSRNRTDPVVEMSTNEELNENNEVVYHV